MADPDFTDTARAALLWVLWHHQGGSSPTGQAVRFALGMGQFDRMTADQLAQAKAWAPGIPGLAHTDPTAAPARQFTDAEIEAWAERHDIAGNEAQLRVIFDDARSMVPAGVGGNDAS